MQKSSFPEVPDLDAGGMPTPSALGIGERLRWWRRSKKLTQSDLALQLDVNKATLRRYELGLNALTTSHLTLLYTHGVNMNWLLTGEGDMLREDSPEASEVSAAEQKINELADALRKLRDEAPDKFELLTKGFVLRSREALHLAVLEAKYGKKPRWDDIVKPVEGIDQASETDTDDILSAPVPAPKGEGSAGK
ncbi:helix-turn-helix domain-containing protein [Paracidovorax citrulli]|uniref:helix-turn-helix domain-containing protein n=1 Tax=Paracidovorax citrulli TaxID=80869 RepID=UPI003FA7431C